MIESATTRTSKRGRPGYDRETVLSAAVALFNERGYDGTSMEDLSRRLGITKSAIYYHVSSKEELLRLAVNQGLDELFAEVDDMDSNGCRAIERLEHVVRASVSVLVRQLPSVTLLLRIRGNSDVERQALARRREFDQIITDLVGKAAADGDLRPDVDSATAARLIFGMINSLVEWYKPVGGATPEQLTEAVVAMAFDGLRIRTRTSSDDPFAGIEA